MYKELNTNTNEGGNNMENFNSSINKQSWQIRRKAAIELDCLIMEVSWAHCLAMAKAACLTLAKEKKELIIPVIPTSMTIVMISIAVYLSFGNITLGYWVGLLTIPLSCLISYKSFERLNNETLNHTMCNDNSTINRI